jgi:hypothetical protein
MAPKRKRKPAKDLTTEEMAKRVFRKSTAQLKKLIADAVAAAIAKEGKKPRKSKSQD